MAGHCWAAQPLRVLLLLSDNYPSYQIFSQTVQQRMPDAQTRVQLLSEPVQFSQYDVVLALGLAATELAAQQSELPLLAIFVPETAYKNLLKKISPASRQAKMSAIYLNQPWSRQLDFIAAILPNQRNIAVLYNPANLTDLTHLREAAQARGQTLITQAVDAEQSLFTQLEAVLNQTQVLLATPDNSIYSSSNVRNILLSTYRFNIPLIGFSSGYVNAGALAAIFSSPEQVAAQAVSHVQKIVAHQNWQGAQYPDAFSMALNAQIFRSLSIELPSETEIRKRMQHIERGEHD
ncbi:MAG: ABC transporter substrate-binding protein [Gallionella sp.]